MKRSVHCILAIAIAISFLALPIPGFAQGYNMATITADGFQLTVDDATFDISASVRLSAGTDDSAQRSFFSGDLYGGGTSILQLLIAMEDAQIKGYMQNAEGGLSHFVQAPLHDILAFFGPAAGAGTGTASELPPLGSILQSFRGSSGAVFLEMLADQIEHIAGDAFGAQTIGKERIELFGETVEAEATEIVLDLAQYLTLIEEVSESDRLLQALWQQVKRLYEKESGKAFSKIPALLAAAGVETSVTIFVYKADENSGRIMTDILVSIGNRQAPPQIIMDYGAGEGHAAIDIELAATLPDEGDASIYVRVNNSADEATAKGYAEAGFSITADGVVNEFEFTIENQSTEADGTVTGGGIGDIIGKQASGQGAATDTAVIAIKAKIPAEGLDFSLDIKYDGKHYDQDGDLAYYGKVACDMEEGGEEVGAIAFNIECQLSYMPEGELLSPGGMATLNPFNADEEALSIFQESVLTVLRNAQAIANQTLGSTESVDTSESTGGRIDPEFGLMLRRL